MADITVDPLTAVYDELFLILTDSTDFAALTEPGNLINYVGKRKPADPEKETHSNADFNEIKIVGGGIIPHLQNTSNSSRLTASYGIEVRTGTKDIGRAHYPMVWAIFKAMRPWATRLRALTIAENGSAPFVVTGRPQGTIREGIEREEISDGVSGWFSIWTIDVDMWFTSSALS